MKKNNNLKYLIVFMNFHLILASCVTFNLDLNNFNELPEGNWVARANGSWNNWGTGITLSDNDNNGIFTYNSEDFISDSYPYANNQYDVGEILLDYGV